MDKLGVIPNPEQYAETGDDVILGNSVDALNFFRNSYGGDGVVLLVNVSFSNLTYPTLLAWMYWVQNDQVYMPVTPVFKVDNSDILQKCKILQLQPLKNEIFLFWKGSLYATVFTSTGEVVVKKVRAVLSAIDALNIIKLENNFDVEDIYPVELYSPQEKKFICICWSIVLRDDNCVFWRPACEDDAKLLNPYKPDTLTEYPINIGETAIIGGEVFKLCYNSVEGSHFEKFFPEQTTLKISSRGKIDSFASQNEETVNQNEKKENPPNKVSSEDRETTQKKTETGSSFLNENAQTETVGKTVKIIKFVPKH